MMTLPLDFWLKLQQQIIASISSSKLLLINRLVVFFFLKRSCLRFTENLSDQ